MLPNTEGRYVGKADEVRAVLGVFHQSDYEDLDEISAAEKIRSALLAEWKGAMRETPPVIREGLAFKFPWSSTVHHVAYVDELHSGEYRSAGNPLGGKRSLSGAAWITNSTCRYGGLLPLEWEGWSLISRSSAKSGGAGENEKGWKVAERVKFGQFGNLYEIVQTHAKCVLLRDFNGHLMAEPNDVMASFRRAN